MSGGSIAKATFTPLTGANRHPIPVHFNPGSLQFSVSNTLKKEEGSGKKGKQYVTRGTGKLTMDLVFDTTDTGEDVRKYTKAVQALMEPAASPGSKQQVARVVSFGWGSYGFEGMLESYKETLDFFAPEGVPLRASVALTLVEQDEIFRKPEQTSAKDDPITLPTGENTSAASVAGAGGNGRAARDVAAQNGEQSVRFSSGASLTVGASVSLAPPAAFADGAVGGSANASFGAGFAAGASFGASASAGVAASAGAFAGLRVPVRSAGYTLDVDQIRVAASTPVIAAGPGALFRVGGQAIAGGSAGPAADVGLTADLRARIRFEED